MPQLKPTRGICLNRSHPLSRGLVGCWLFNEGCGNKVFDSSGNGNIGTFAAVNPPRWQAGYINFDAGVERIVVPHKSVIDFATEAFSVTVCFRTISAYTQYILNKNYGGAGAAWYSLSVSGGEVAFHVDDGTTLKTIASLLSIYNDGKWHKGVGIRNANTGKLELYVDGISCATPILDTTVSISNTEDLFIGCRADLSESRDFIGDIKFASIYNRALSASDILKLYKKPFRMFEWVKPVFSIPVVAKVAARRRSRMGFKPVEGAERLRGLRRYSPY